MTYDNKYQYIKDLGTGGFGRVFLAKEDVSDKLFAIKELKDKDPEAQSDIIKEIRQVAAFNNDSIVGYVTNFKQNGLLYLVMEYCEHGNLYDRQKVNPLSSSEIIELIKQTALSLDYVHDQKIVHHDIKPANILIGADGKAKIADFGIVNSGGGTRAYMCPESFDYDYNIVDDVRADIYALGVTLMELLCGNPFFHKSFDEIIALHDSKDFPITSLQQWLQEIILKAINKIPELRFQTMKDFAESLAIRQVPFFIKKDVIQAGKYAEQIEKMLHSKKWNRAGKFVEEGNLRFSDSVNVLIASGKYYLLKNKIETAKNYFDKALRLNPRLQIQKELAEINLHLKNYSVAISLISDHLHRHSSDYEAYNLLLKCYYETNRYEAGIELGKIVLCDNPDIPAFCNNYYLCHIMQNLRSLILPETVLKARNNPFIDYNMSVCFEDEEFLSHGYENKPALKSKLLFADYRFNKSENSILYFKNNPTSNEMTQSSKFIIKFGRVGYDVNDIQVPGGTAISRRHCIIINAKDDVWLYDLNSTGILLNGKYLKDKDQIVGLNTIKIYESTYTVTTDNNLLL